MQTGSYVVPWADRSEWKDVRAKIFSGNVDDIIEAHKIMSVWQLRSDNLPAHVDCTAGILHVMIQEHLAQESGANDYDLRLCYSMALIRFVNHVHNVSDSRYDSLYRAAKMQNIPDWIITMRHDASHGRDMPTLETFHLAALISLEWLMKNYWFQEEIYMSNLEATVKHYGDDILPDNINLSVLPIYKTAFKVWGTCAELMNNSLTSISNLSSEQISSIYELLDLCKANECIKKNGLNSFHWMKKLVKRFKKGETSLTKEKHIVKNVKNDIVEVIKSLTYDSTTKYTFVQSLLQSDFMLDTTQKEWRRIIHLVQTLKCFTIFMECLFQLAGDEHDMALILLYNLFPSVETLKNKWAYYYGIIQRKALKKPKKEVMKLVRQNYFKKHKHLKLPLRLQKLPEIKLEMLSPLLRNPTIQSKELIFKYLSIVEPQLPSSVFDMCSSLINLYCGSGLKGQDPDDESDKIYTLEDIRLQIEMKEEVNKTSVTDSEQSDWVRSDFGIQELNECPLGLLPNQEAVDCELPENLQWKSFATQEEKKQSQGKKRKNSPLSNQATELNKLCKSLKTFH